MGWRQRKFLRISLWLPANGPRERAPGKIRSLALPPDWLPENGPRERAPALPHDRAPGKIQSLACHPIGWLGEPPTRSPAANGTGKRAPTLLCDQAPRHNSEFRIYHPIGWFGGNRRQLYHPIKRSRALATAGAIGSTSRPRSSETSDASLPPPFATTSICVVVVAKVEGTTPSGEEQPL